jgi:DEAD/DEAH box helicase domain-containing protein
MVARLKRMREQRERREPRPRPAPRATANGSFEPRFHPGDRIVCTPYGAGEVLESRVEDERELLVVDFPEHGELTIDAAVNAARLAEDVAPPEETDF